MYTRFIQYLLYTTSKSLHMLPTKTVRNELHGYTVLQQYPTLYFQSNAHNFRCFSDRAS